MESSSKNDPIAVLLRGCENVYTPDELRQRIASGRRLRVKLGMDPTAPDLTLGHTVVLRKLRQFQDHGHLAVLIIGDYTAKIGDPTGRTKTRPMLTDDEIRTNATTYMQQAGKVLDVSPEKLEVRYNGEWLEKMSCADVIKLMSEMTVARMLERDTFAKRQAEGKEIFLHELLYPLMQAKDSVEIRADVELGGSDQTFNNLCGRDLQRTAGQPPQIVMTTPLLVGTDGKNKMSKSMGNYIAVTDPPSEMFGKIMRIPDELIGNYFELLTDASQETIADATDFSKVNPRVSKEQLAREVIRQYHSAGDADSAAAEFKRVHGGGGGGLPDDMPEVTVPSDKVVNGAIVPIDLLVDCLGEKSRSEARRVIGQKGVKLNGVVIEDANAPLAIKPGDILQRGNRKFVKLVF